MINSKFLISRIILSLLLGSGCYLDKQTDNTKSGEACTRLSQHTTYPSIDNHLMMLIASFTTNTNTNTNNFKYNYKIRGSIENHWHALSLITVASSFSFSLFVSCNFGSGSIATFIQCQGALKLSHMVSHFSTYKL